MTQIPASTGHVVIVGAGIIGLSAAWRLLQADCQVTIVDAEPGAGASRAAAGMLAPVTEADPMEPALLEFGLRSAGQWGDFADELTSDSGQPVGYRTDGTLVVARTHDDLTALAELERRYQALDLQVSRVTGSELRSAEPMLAAGVRGGLLAEQDHSVDNRLAVGALLAACRSRGATFVAQRVRGLVRSADGTRVVGVRCDQEVLAADVVILCAGSWLPTIEGAEALPIRPVQGELLRLRSRDVAPLRHSVRALVDGRAVYLVPRRDGRLVVGATMHERGFDVTPTAGGIHDLLADARSVLPTVDDLLLEEVVVGLRPGTPDNAPLIGWLGDGLLVACGHFRNGILLAPATAEAVAAAVTVGVLPDWAKGFDPMRFSSEDGPR